MRSASPWSATCSSRVVVFPAKRCLMTPLDSPMRSIVPAAMASPPTGLTSWYLSEDEPEFITSTEPCAPYAEYGLVRSCSGRTVMRMLRSCWTGRSTLPVPGWP
ncbi:hypothetical protein D3C74_357010 [compost metagenome]